MEVKIPQPTFRRLPTYLRYLERLCASKIATVSSSVIAAALKLKSIQVRKDFALISSVGGRPGSGFCICDLIRDIKHILCYNRNMGCVLVGVGVIGDIMLSYPNHDTNRLEVVAAFDTDPKIIGNVVGKITVMDFEKDFVKFVTENNILIGVITAKKNAAQEIANTMVECGIKAIWNFVDTYLTVPEGVTLKNEDIAGSVSILINAATQY